ncbi:hypothetical protein N7603_04770 [Acholeplasma vituli]|uniref:Integral membrane protein n=1 Tax=Paracholeplasma vituli TaxID=69473 RepID=A0ABT2PVI3_9MOLU|nr:hypothetical protein [Paracholeplasma vituli]MCU0104965.1 hypothetical protein [Paracholeplasma vituli]
MKMIKKFDLKLATMAIIAGVFRLVAGIVFYTTFVPPIMTVFIPELEAFQAWTAIAMVLGAVFVTVAVLNYLAPKKKWWGFILIVTLVLAIILEIVLTILLFKNTNYVANSSILLVLLFFVIALYIVILATLSIQNRTRYTKN